jgi:PDZ domain-containing protein
VLFPGDKTDAEINEETASQMNESQYVSTIAAFKELGFAMEPDGALVLRTFEGAVAAKSLAAGDIVTSFDGKAIKTSRQLREIARTKPSELVAAKFRRGADLLDASIEVSPEGDPIGVDFRQSLELPFRVKFEVGSIGGPSAGLTFALAIVNLLTPEDLTGGKLIADTGTITEDGVVGPIGGIAQKVAAAEEFGAEVFLSPKEHEEEARSVASESMTVIGVSTLREAIDALRGLK